MRVLLFLTLMCSLALTQNQKAAGQVPASQVSAGQPLSPAQVEAVIQQFQQQTGVPGVAVVVVQQGQTRLYGSGLSPQTPVAIASMSKSFTALAALQLAESGQLQLDLPVQEVLPTFRMADPRARQITVRHLLNQTSGLSDLASGQGLGSQRVTRQALLQGLQQARLSADPGIRFEYANVNYALLALLIERVTGEPFGATVQRRILRPLGMHAYLAENCAETFSGQAGGHTMLLKLALSASEPAGLCLGSGGVVTSAEALGHWLQEQFGPRPQLMTAQQRHLMQSPPRGADSTYGMGWYAISSPELPAYLGHGGNLVTAASHMVYDPSTDTALAALLDSNGPAALLTLNLLRARHGLPVQQMRSPTLTLDLLLLTLGAVLTLWAVWSCRQHARWHERTRTWPRWRRVISLLPLALFPVAVALLPWFAFGASPLSWPVTLTLLPSSAALWAAALACAGLLGRRLTTA
ncbi:MAG: serine hydrolase domain-containing protein [Deinococcus sp.]|nr:serine hydrolase domain-containing protein [Deinococcus sp.]